MLNPDKILSILTAPVPRSNIEAILYLFPNLILDEVEACRMEFIGNDKFFSEINKKMVEQRHRRTNCGGWHEFLYMVVRFSSPKIIFETGVFDGESSAVILQALNDNGNGILASIDLPSINSIECSTSCMGEVVLPLNCQPGWVIPDYLKERYQLILGDSKKILPELF